MKGAIALGEYVGVQGREPIGLAQTGRPKCSGAVLGAFFPIRQPDIAKPTMHNKPVLMICPSTRSGQTKEAIASHLDR